MALLGHPILLSLAPKVTPILLQASRSAASKFTFHKLYVDMGWIAFCVLIVLMVMSIYSIAIMFERYLTFKAASSQSRKFVPRAAEMFKTSRLDEALKLSQEYGKSHLAVVVNSGLQELAAGHEAKASRQMEWRRPTRSAKFADAAIRGHEVKAGLRF